MIRVGLVGFGLAGQAFHAPVIRSVDGLHLGCVVSRSGSLARQKYPAIRVVRTVEEMLADDEIRLCVIATPNETHFSLAQLCIGAGRHVVVDKPFTVTSTEAAELIRIADSRRRVLSVFHERRWDGDFRTVRKLLREGTLGRVVAFESNYDRYRPAVRENAWRERDEAGSGMLYDLGAHLIDQAMALFGVPDAITADLRVERDGARVEDAFDVRFTYARLAVTLRCTMLAVAPRPRFRIFGTAGAFVKQSFDPQEERLRRGEIPGGAGWGEDEEANWGTLYRGGEGGIAGGSGIGMAVTAVTAEKLRTEPGDYRGFYENVRDAILGGAALEVTGRDGRNAIRAIELAKRSSVERRTIAWSDAA
jgi:predicted dehydrogenase